MGNRVSIPWPEGTDPMMYSVAIPEGLDDMKTAIKILKNLWLARAWTNDQSKIPSDGDCDEELRRDGGYVDYFGHVPIKTRILVDGKLPKVMNGFTYDRDNGQGLFVVHVKKALEQ